METLLKPDFGLVFWTGLTFIILVALLGRFVWKPVLHALEEREKRLAAEREAAEEARLVAEKIRSELDERLKHIRDETQAAIEAANISGAQVKNAMIDEAKGNVKTLVENARKEMENEKQRLIMELRQEVADLSVMAAEKILNKKIDAASQKDVLEDFFREIKRTDKI